MAQEVYGLLHESTLGSFQLHSAARHAIKDYSEALEVLFKCGRVHDYVVEVDETDFKR
jgi:hypothetical protein